VQHLSPVIAPSRSPHLWIVLLVHQVARLGSGHEAMSAKKQLKEALEGASNEVDGFRIQLTNLGSRFQCCALTAAMKDTTNNRALHLLIQGHLVSATVRTVGAPSVRYFFRSVSDKTSEYDAMCWTSRRRFT